MSRPPEKSYLPRGWVTSLEKSVGAVRRGEWALCRTRGDWQSCRVEEEPGDSIQVTLAADSVRQGLRRDDVVSVPSGLREWVGRRAGEAARPAARQPATWPTQPLAAGQTVAVGDVVLARWSGGGWWVAKVLAIGAGGMTVAWADGSPEEVLPPVKVAPIVPGSSLQQGDLALCRWRGDNEFWPARVERVANGALSITYSDGDTADVPPEACVAAR